MANLRLYSTASASNATVGSFNAAEGMAPSAVNDSLRIYAADVKTFANELPWRDLMSASYISATAFGVTGDFTTTFQVRRRVKFTDSSTLYGSISTATYSGTTTTVTVVMDSGSLSASLTAAGVAVEDATNVSKAANFGLQEYATTAGTSTAYTAAFTPKNVALTNGVRVRVKIHTDCGATPTLAVDGLTAKTIVLAGNTAVASGDLLTNAVLDLTYDGTLDKWVVSGPLTAAAVIGQGRHTIIVNGTAMKKRTTNGPSDGVTESTTNKVMEDGIDFDASTDEYAQFKIPMPKSWNEGTVTFKAHWTAVATGAGVVTWGLQANSFSDDDALDAAFGTAQTVSDTLTTTSDLMISAESAAVTVGGTPQAEDLVVFQVYRNASHASDTLAVDARLLSLVIYVTINAATDT